jgi:hypothetical protein
VEVKDKFARRPQNLPTDQPEKRLDRFDLISAMTFTESFDLRERFKRDHCSA